MSGTAHHAARRARVLAELGADNALIVGAAPELVVGRDTELRYVVDSDLYYLTGYTEPEAVLVLMPGHDAGAFHMFVRPRDPQRELWAGVRGGVAAARAQFGADAAYPIEELAERLPALTERAHVLYARLHSGHVQLDALLPQLVAKARRTRPRTGLGPLTIAEPSLLLDELRLIKDAHEIELMRAAARITVTGHDAAVQAVGTVNGEWQIEAAVEGTFRARGADGAAFPTIAAAGANATVLHYTANASPLESGTLLLVDAGARYRGYCADMTRTWAIGAVSQEMRALHAVVCRAHAAGIAAAQPGSTLDDVHDAAVIELTRGLVELGVLTAAAETPAERNAAIKPYYPHRTSHWIGLDVHDVGDYVIEGAPRTLAEGMVFTVEPGLYFAADAGVPAALRGVGVRIEDTVLITAHGAEVLTAGIPTSLNG